MQADQGMASLALKKRGEISPQLAQLRTLHTHSSHHPPITPLARPPLTHRTPPVPLELTTAAPNATPSSRTQTPPISSDGRTSRGHSSGQSSTNEVHARKKPSEVKDVQVKSERLSISPVPTDSCGTRRHPLVTATKADQRETIATKQAEKRPQHCHRDTTPPLPVSHVKQPNSDPTLRVSESESENDAGSDKAGGGGAEQARKKRQELQRLQKEKWQLKHGLNARRALDSSPSPSPEEERDGVGGVCDDIISDDIISEGK